MKKILIFAVTCLTLFSCNIQKSEGQEKKLIVLSNNYNLIWRSEQAPNSIAIKKQRIIDNNEGSNNESTLTIEANPDGFITSVYGDEYKLLEVDYINAIFKSYDDEDQAQIYQLKLDENNNIIETFNDRNEQASYAKFDDRGRVTNIFDVEGDGDDGDDELNLTHTKELSYFDNNKLAFFSNKFIYISEEHPQEDLFKSYFFYNDQNQLIKSIAKYSLRYSNEKTDDNSPLERLKEACFYSNHNQHGDWTQSYCVNEDNKRISSSSRSLEY